MTPTRIYVNSVLTLAKTGALKGVAHITGEGLTENPPRAIAEGLVPRFDCISWTVPPVFDWLQRTGGVAETEMRRAFNCGIGLILIVAPSDAADVLSGLLAAGENSFVCGEVARA